MVFISNGPQEFHSLSSTILSHDVYYCYDMETLSKLLAFSKDKSLLAHGFPSQRVSNVEIDALLFLAGVTGDLKRGDAHVASLLWKHTAFHWVCLTAKMHDTFVQNWVYLWMISHLKYRKHKELNIHLFTTHAL